MARDMYAMRIDHIARTIAENPTDITITRTEKTVSGGGFASSTTQKGPFTVRIFQDGRAGAHARFEQPGHKAEDAGWGLLADRNADIKAGPDVEDTFEVAGLGTFSITDVTPQYAVGKLAGFHAKIERVM